MPEPERFSEDEQRFLRMLAQTPLSLTPALTAEARERVLDHLLGRPTIGEIVFTRAVGFAATFAIIAFVAGGGVSWNVARLAFGMCLASETYDVVVRRGPWRRR